MGRANRPLVLRATIMIEGEALEHCRVLGLPKLVIRVVGE